MTRQRLVQVGALVAPVLVSSMVWLWTFALAPLVGLVLAVGAIVLVSRWESAAVLRWRYRVRPASLTERDAVLAALVPALSLRGRTQPTVWVTRAQDRPVMAMTERDLAVADLVVAAVLRGRYDPEEFTASVLYAIGTRRGRRPVEVLVDLYCWPWEVLANVGGGMRGVARLPLVKPLWRLRFITGGVAVAQQTAAGRIWVAAGIVLLLGLTYAHPWCRACQAEYVQRAGDEYLSRAGFGQVFARMLRRTGATTAIEERAHRLEDVGTSTDPTPNAQDGQWPGSRSWPAGGSEGVHPGDLRVDTEEVQP